LPWFRANWLSQFLRQYKKAKRPYYTLLKYTLLQVPEFLLVIFILVILKKWIAMPALIVWGIVLLWLVKDIILFPLTWRAYDSGRQYDPHPMVGRRGVVQEPLAPSGYIRVGGELWMAEAIGDQGLIEKGERVCVRGVNGLKLFVDREIAKSDS
jgi:membrane protein implicated in regulation of membrane protease activity